MSALNYPTGLTDSTPGTPWNDPVAPEREFEVTVCQTLSKSTKVSTCKYQPEFDEEYGVPYASTEDTDWSEVFRDNGCHTPLELIQLLGEVLQRDKQNGVVFKTPGFTELLINECRDWTDDETVIEEM